MVNFNGELVSDSAAFFNHKNRGFRFGDSLFEEIRVVNGQIIFLEEHYFRLMANMRIVRMEIPMDFTMEFIREQILATIEANSLLDAAALVRISVSRIDGTHIAPRSNQVNYILDCKKLNSPFYILESGTFEVELFKDFYVNPDMLSNLDVGNKMLQVTASIFASENGYEDCLLLNGNKQVIGATSGNLFLVKGMEIKTAPLSAGATNSVIRKKLLEMMASLDSYKVIEEPISPFELQKADELFILNTEKGIQPITQYRKKKFELTVAKELLGKLNAHARLANLK